MGYFNYSNVFLIKNAAKLLKYTRINNYIIKPKKDKLPPFGLIYSLKPVELEILKTYMKTNLINGFIWSFKFPTKVSIFFYQKLNKILYLCINYSNLNNLIIKYQYVLLFIAKISIDLAKLKS